MLLAHSSFPIRLHSILVKKPCPCKKKLDTWNIPVEKAQSSLFVVSKNPFTFWGTISFIQYERLVHALFLVNCFYHFAQGTSQNNSLDSNRKPSYFRKGAAYVKGLHVEWKFNFIG